MSAPAYLSLSAFPLAIRSSITSYTPGPGSIPLEICRRDAVPSPPRQESALGTPSRPASPPWPIPSAAELDAALQTANFQAAWTTAHIAAAAIAAR